MPEKLKDGHSGNIVRFVRFKKNRQSARLGKGKVYEWICQFKRGDICRLNSNRDLGVLQQAEATKAIK